jgi:hypothetical protein
LPQLLCKQEMHALPSKDVRHEPYPPPPPPGPLPLPPATPLLVAPLHAAIAPTAITTAAVVHAFFIAAGYRDARGDLPSGTSIGAKRLPFGADGR